MSDSDTPQPSVGSKRKHLTCACSECRRRKVRCSGEYPCSRCTKMMLTCIYPVQKKRGFKKRTLDTDVKAEKTDGSDSSSSSGSSSSSNHSKALSTSRKASLSGGSSSGNSSSSSALSLHGSSLANASAATHSMPSLSSFLQSHHDVLPPGWSSSEYELGALAEYPPPLSSLSPRSAVLRTGFHEHYLAMDSPQQFVIALYIQDYQAYFPRLLTTDRLFNPRTNADHAHRAIACALSARCMRDHVSVKKLEQEIRWYASRIFDEFSVENAFAIACMTRYFVILDDEDMSHHYFTIADSMCNRLEKNPENLPDVLRIRIMLCNVMIDVEFLSKTQTRLRDVFAKPNAAISQAERHMLQVLAGSELLRDFFHAVFNNPSEKWPVLSEGDAAHLLKEINSLNDMITALGRKTIEQMAIAVCHMARALIMSCSSRHDDAMLSVQAAFLKMRASSRYLGYAHPSLLWCLHAQIDVCLRASRLDLAQRVLSWEREMASYCPRMQKYFDEDEVRLSKLQFESVLSYADSATPSALRHQPPPPLPTSLSPTNAFEPLAFPPSPSDSFDDSCATPPSPRSITVASPPCWAPQRPMVSELMAAAAAAAVAAAASSSTSALPATSAAAAAPSTPSNTFLAHSFGAAFGISDPTDLLEESSAVIADASTTSHFVGTAASQTYSNTVLHDPTAVSSWPVTPNGARDSSLLSGFVGTAEQPQYDAWCL